TVGAWYISHGFEYVPSGIQLSCFADELIRTLDVQRSQNRVVIVSVDEDVRDYVHDNVLASWTFRRGCGTVRLLATDGIPLKGLLAVNSTCAMNILSHRAAYCCFPKLTLEQRSTVLIDLCAPFTESQMSTVKNHQMQGFSVQFKPSGRTVCNAKSAMTFLYSRYLGDKHCYKIPVQYLGKKGLVDDYIEANTWSLAYTRKHNTCDYYPIDVPGTRTEYIASTSFASNLETQLIVLRGYIQSRLISSEAAVLMVQELARRKRRRLADEASYRQLSSILSIAESANFHIDAAVAQDLFEYLDMLNDQFSDLKMSTPIVKIRSRTGPVLRVTFTLQKPVKDFGWMTLKRWAARFAFDNVILHLHRKFR
ncbi:hypothetical protein F5051DRAFT_238053, partial [Lentinula edodes]